jgi:hypothetical protein
VLITEEDLAKLGPNHLAQEIAERVAKAPQRWTMVVTVADPGDPTADPSKACPPLRIKPRKGSAQKVAGFYSATCNRVTPSLHAFVVSFSTV